MIRFRADTYLTFFTFRLAARCASVPVQCTDYPPETLSTAVGCNHGRINEGGRVSESKKSRSKDIKTN